MRLRTWMLLIAFMALISAVLGSLNGSAHSGMAEYHRRAGARDWKMVGVLVRAAPYTNRAAKRRFWDRAVWHAEMQRRYEQARWWERVE